MKKIVIFGAGGQSQAVLEALSFDENISVIGYIDKDSKLHGENISNLPVLGDITHLHSLKKLNKVDGVFVAIGDNYIRERYTKILQNLGLEIINAFHPSAVISKKAQIGVGVYVGPGTVIGPYVEIGDHCLINMNSSIPHYNKIGEFVNVAPNVAIGGGTIVGNNSFIGIGASLIQYIEIGRDVIVGAGAAVINNIDNGSIVVGVPGKIIKKNYLTNITK
ncbi:acetyltransferase [Bacillus mycoides]|uniref:acetyltransferase n=1 Tax=Bacillus mycoides TaxID=1405 RepID=UPI001C01CEAD|nr:acetyltransferase [Bacillus mycoides]